MFLPRYTKTRWPEGEPGPGEPLWFFYELDRSADAVVRSVWIYPDGRVTRNSIEIEERNGKACPSLIDCSLERGFEGVELEEISRHDFERIWDTGVDTPFWNIG